MTSAAEHARSCFLDAAAAHAKAAESLSSSVGETGLLLSRCLREGGKVLVAGNGGSAADAQHFAAELSGRFIADRKPLAGIALSTDTSALTAIGNDYGFAEVFARQVEALGRRGDAFVGISTSGKSPNILAALSRARSTGMHTIMLCGHGQKAELLHELTEYADAVIAVPSSTTARIQEVHTTILHAWCTIIESELFAP